MSLRDVQDVLIIGGGPAGSTAGTFLAKYGHRVTIFEKEQFPRDHVGESLLPFCYKLFDQLGLLDEMKQRFVRKPGVRFVDSDGVATTTWCFSHVIHDNSYLSFQVLRSEFDTMLLNNSRRHGATAKEATKVESVNLNAPDGLVEVKARGPNGQLETHLGRFLLDCSGRGTFLANMKGLKQKFPNLDRTALWTHFSGGELAGGLEEGLSLIVYLGGDKQGWIWVFPLGKDRLTIGVVLNNEYIRAQKSKLSQNGSRDWVADLFYQELGLSPYVQKLISDAHTIQPLTIEGDYSYYIDGDSKFGENYAMVGDAATFIDPIFSSGIFLAMNSSRLVSEAIHTRLTAGKEKGDQAIRAAYAKVNGGVKMVHRLISFFYSRGTINFAQMELAQDTIHREHQDAMSVGHFLLAGDFFDRYETYGKVVDLLSNPNIYEIYRQSVLNRSDFQVLSCGETDYRSFPAVNGRQATPPQNGHSAPSPMFVSPLVEPAETV